MTAAARITMEGPAPLLCLDLDGTVRHGREELGRFVNGPDDVVIFPEAVTMMRRWKQSAGRIVGITNQGGIALGHFTEAQCNAALEATDELTGRLFDLIELCPHHPDAADPEQARCSCRKPSPGLVVEAKIRLNARFPGEYYPSHLGLFVGDRPEDEECARLAGMDFIWAKDWRAQAG